MNLQQQDIDLCTINPHYENLEPLKYCTCGGKPHIDVSMALIQCDICGLAFEYRYIKGVVPYHTWQYYHTPSEAD